MSDPDVIGDQRFPLVCVAPVTGTPGEGLLHPPLAPGKSGVVKKSFALIEIAAIDEGLVTFLGLGERLNDRCGN